MSVAMAEADRRWTVDYRPRSNASVEIVDDDRHLLTWIRGFYCGAKVRPTSVDRRMISDAKVYSNLRLGHEHV